MNLTQRNHLWTELQTAIAAQLERTPGEYDVVTLIERIARQYADTKYCPGIAPYNAIATYLEDRYDPLLRITLGRNGLRPV